MRLSSQLHPRARERARARAKAKEKARVLHPLSSATLRSRTCNQQPFVAYVRNQSVRLCVYGFTGLCCSYNDVFKRFGAQTARQPQNAEQKPKAGGADLVAELKTQSPFYKKVTSSQSEQICCREDTTKGCM